MTREYPDGSPMTAEHNEITDRASDLCDHLMACVRQHCSDDNQDVRTILLAFGMAAGCYAHAMNNPQVKVMTVRNFVETFIETAGVPLTVVGRS